jgi:hypothetical protein
MSQIDTQRSKPPSSTNKYKISGSRLALSPSSSLGSSAHHNTRPSPTAVRLSRGGRQTGSTTMRVLPLLLLLDHHLGRTNGFHRPPRASKNPPLTSTAAPSQIGPSSLRSPKLRLDRINKFDQMVNEITLPETVIEFIDGDKQLLFRALNAGVREAEVLQAAAIVYEDLAPVRFGKVMLYPKSLKKRALLTHDARFSSTPTHSWRPNLRGALHHRHGRL